MIKTKSIDELVIESPITYEELVDNGFKLVKWDKVYSNNTQVSIWGLKETGHTYMFRYNPWKEPKGIYLIGIHMSAYEVNKK